MRGPVVVFVSLALSACTSVRSDTSSLEGTTWRIATINGRTAPPTGDYQIRFERGQIGGRAGCNHFGGPYRVVREMLTVSQLASTMMACNEPHMSFESWGLAVLQQPMRISWASGTRLTLSNDSGSIALARIA